MTAHDISQLSSQERLDLIGALWDSLTDQEVALTSPQEAELARRLANFDADRRNATPWREIAEELENRG